MPPTKIDFTQHTSTTASATSIHQLQPPHSSYQPLNTNPNSIKHTKRPNTNKMVNFNLSTLLLAVLGTASLATAGPSCNQMPDKKAVASDAARAIDIIRTWGDQPCFVGTTTSISKHGRAEIIAVYGRGGDTTISW